MRKSYTTQPECQAKYADEAVRGRKMFDVDNRLEIRLETCRIREVIRLEVMMRGFISVVVMALMVPAPVRADALHDQLLRQAHAGDRVAQRKIGIRKFEGASGTLVDRKNALLWLQEAVNNGDTEAMYYLGSLYEKGFHVGQDMKRAVALLERAANQGHAKARAKLERMPLNVIFTIVDERAGRGEVQACLRIAEAFLCGRDGMERDAARGRDYFLKAWKQNDESALRALNRWPLKSTLPVWVCLAEDERCEAALMRLARLYEKGAKGVERDSAMAKKYYELAAQEGNAEAEAWVKQHIVPKLADASSIHSLEDAAALTEADCLRLAGVCDAQGEPYKALLLRYSAAMRQDVDAMVTLKIRYGCKPLWPWASKGDDNARAKRDFTPSVRMDFERATLRDDPEAQCRMGHFYAALGEVLSPIAAASWYELAARQGHAEAQYCLGKMLSEAAGKPHNAEWQDELLRKAKMWLNAAAEQNIGEAQSLLRSLAAPGQVSTAS